MSTSTLRCPTCDRPFDPEQSRSVPFCSPRCRQIDLGRWLREDIGLPYEHPEEGEKAQEPGRDDD